MAAPIISIRNLGKRYRLGDALVHDTLRDHLMHAARSVKGWFQSSAGKEASPGRPEDFWALKDVSFDVQRGEVLGIIGRNGAGKSTLLKILSQITEPTEGEIRVKGRIASLLEVGTGFHPELSGRENIFLNGAILGMSRREILRRFDEIVEFAEVGKFLDTPVKRYSSGMYVRLAFAVAAHLEPEILVVDEVLAVGDAQFQKKCLGRMKQVGSEGRTVFFVSHNMAAVNGLCQRVVWLDQGRLQQDGATEQITTNYLTSGARMTGRCEWPEGAANPNVNEFKLHAITLRNERGGVVSRFDNRESFSVEMEYEVLKPLPFCRVGIIVNTTDGVTVFDAYDVDNEKIAPARTPGRYRSRCVIPGNLLNPDRYILSFNAGMPNVKNLARLDGVLVFEVEKGAGFSEYFHFRRAGIINPRLHWEQSSR
jgi:lipopolysaccharide transport system ATP-binding protein